MSSKKVPIILQIILIPWAILAFLLDFLEDKAPETFPWEETK